MHIPSPPTVPSGTDFGSTFRGRHAEIDALLESHRYQVEARQTLGDARAVGPVILTIHGMPGVGKSMLARRVGSLLAKNYPDGMLSENFGKGGGPAPPGEILKRLLVRLGRTEDEVPEDSQERANLFRSLTAGKRILFEFDAARNHDQVLQVLPAEPGCAVIISSRRDLSAQLSTRPGIELRPPSLEDALEILTAVSGFDWMLQAEHAVEVVELCGHLPAAIVAVAERILLDGTDLRQVAEALRIPEKRLSRLDRDGRGLSERFLSEYRRLLPRQQQALCLLTLIKSPTFIPWVLSPLLQVGRREAENVAAALGAAQLLETAGPDEAIGVARYRFNPLVKLFAQEQLLSYPPSVVDAAREALDVQYLALADEVLAQLYSRDQPAREASRSGAVVALARRIAARPEVTIRRECHSLLHIIPLALQRSHVELAWRTAAQLHGCVPMGRDVPDPRHAIGSAIEAAKAEGNVLAHVDAELGLAGYLVAVEDYSAAFSLLSSISDRVRSEPAASSVDAVEHSRRLVQAQQWLVEAFVQMGDYRQAKLWVEATDEVATAAGGDEQALAALLTADAYGISGLGDDHERLVERHSNDRVLFRALISQSEEHRRRGHWSQARADLLGAVYHGSGDARRVASIHYRLARLHIDQWRSFQPNQGFPTEAASGSTATLPPQEPDELSTTAVREAATAALRFRQMDNVVGVNRARCLLARALLTAGKPLAAERLLRSVREALSRPELGRDPAYPALTSRYAQAHGELQLQRRVFGAAWRSLCHAATRFESYHDFSSNQETWQLLETISYSNPYPIDAYPPDLALMEAPQPVGLLPEVLAHYNEALIRETTRPNDEALESEDAATGGRSVRAWIADGELRVGVATQVQFAIGPSQPAHTSSSCRVTVMLHCESAEVTPYGRRIQLDHQATQTLSFEVVPRKAGPTRLRFQIYNDDAGVLLQELESGPMVIGSATEVSK